MTVSVNIIIWQMHANFFLASLEVSMGVVSTPDFASKPGLIHSQWTLEYKHGALTCFLGRDRKLLPGFLRFQDARRPKMSKYSHRCCFPAWGIMGSRVISTSTPVISTTTSVSVCQEIKVLVLEFMTKPEIKQMVTRLKLRLFKWWSNRQSL